MGQERRKSSAIQICFFFLELFFTFLFWKILDTLIVLALSSLGEKCVFGETDNNS